MTRRIRILLGVLSTLVVLLATLVVVGYWLVHRSHSDLEGEERVGSLSGPVEVRRDGYGMVHIRAGTTEDAYRAVGFVHAQDRLWQMELFRRVGEGRLAEILGKDALPVDRLFRTLGLKHIAEQMEAALDPETRAALEAYTQGINDAVGAFKGTYPVEFDMLNVEPAPWEISQSLLVSRLMAWELDYSRWMDVLLSVFVSRFGYEKASELFPRWSAADPTIVKDRTRAEVVGGAESFMMAELAARRVLGTNGLGHGSNAWAVSGSRTGTGKPFLANDPHLLLLAPGRFHEVHMVAPGLDVSGLTIPGIPFVIIGRNRSIAWGLTNAMIDDHDFYVEEVDSIREPTRYRLDGRWETIGNRIDTILVKDALPVVLTTYRTHRGPIVNRLEPSAQWSPVLLSMRWTGQQVSNDARAFLMLNKAATWSDFEDALEHFTVPSQSFVFADTSGNIGYRTAGAVPIRSSVQAMLPSDGRVSSNDWRGFVPFREMPSVLNPPAGFIVSANNSIMPAPYPYHLSDLWEPPWRARRINEVLSASEMVVMEDMQRLQQDVLSPLATEIVPMLVHILSDTSADRQFSQYVTYLRTWDRKMEKDQVAPSIFESFYNRMIHETFADEMGEELLGVYDTLAGMPLTAIRRLLETPNSAWFDDIRTPEREGRDDIVRRSFERALRDLQTRLGTDVRLWRWERLHTLTFSHVLGAVPVLAPLFNIGPFAVGGSHSTVNVGYFLLDGSFNMTVGASTRQVFDLSDPNNTRSVLPPGQSGQVFHRNYDDQVRLWLNGSYRVLPMDQPDVDRQAQLLLKLVP